MTKTILVFALDAEGNELNTPFHEGEESLKAARAEAKRLLRSPEYLDAGLHKVEIRVNGEVHSDFFVPTPAQAKVTVVPLSEVLAPGCKFRVVPSSEIKDSLRPEDYL